MIRILHLADVHLGAPLGGFGKRGPERGRRVLEAFGSLPGVCEGEAVSAVLVAGDLFDGPRPGDAVVASVRETSRRLAAAGVSVFAVPGNHDAVALNPTLYENALPGAHVFVEATFGAPVSVEVAGETLHVYGLAHDPAEAPEPLSSWRKADLPGLHVVLLHGSVPGAPHWDAGTSLRLPLERLAGLEADYIALGDHHRFRGPDGFDEGRVPACYAGSFAAVDLSETGRRGPVLAELAPGEPPRVRHLSSGVPEVVRVDGFDVTPFADESELADAVSRDLPEEAVPVVRLTGEPTFPLDADRVRLHLEARFQGAAVEDDTRYYDSDRLAALARRKTVAGHVARLGLRRLEEARDPETRAVAARGLRIALRALEIG